MSDGAGTAAWRLRPPARSVDPRAIQWWGVRAALGALAVFVALGVAAAVLLAAGSPGLWPVLIADGVVLIVGLTYAVAVPRIRFRVHRWERTDDAVHTLSGWLAREWRAAPIARIQTVDTEQGPLQRLFGLATVTVTTASSSGALRIDGLAAGLAAELARDLTAAAHAAGGDGT